MTAAVDSIAPCTDKACTKCGVCKPITEFGWNNKAKTIRRPDCKACRSVYNAAFRAKNKDALEARRVEWARANADKMRDYYAAYYKANKVRISARKSAHQKLNADAVRLANAAWRHRNPDKVKAQRVAWLETNKHLARAAEQRWRERNPEKRRLVGRQNQANRRARKRIGGGRLSAGIAKKLYALQRGRCACCGKSLALGYHIDHIIPLALGGANDDLNIQLLTPDCNQRKKAQHPVDYMQSQGFLL